MSSEAIITHMNRDHRVSLYDYLAYYGGIKLDLDNRHQSVELVDVQLDRLTLNYNKSGVLKSTVIPLHPPMASLGEARVRFVRMAFEAADALKVSPYRVTRYIPPRSRGMKAFFAAIVAMLAASGAGSVSSSFAARIGLDSRWFRGTLATLIVIHTAEFFVKVLPMLKYYRVPSFARLKYFFSVLSVGIPAWMPLKEESSTLQQRRVQFEAMSKNQK